MDLLQHLFPDFANMFSANPSGISAWFWLVTVFVFGLSIFFLARHYRRFQERMSALNSLMEGQSKDDLALSRRETLQKAQQLKASKVGMLWREFDESLVLSSDQKQLFNTLDAEHFFNARTLANGLTASRLLAAAPSFLVAIGVLGTFVGLTVGLEGLVGTSGEIDALKDGINKLISGAAVAFMTSVWGVALSLALNVIEKVLERNALGKIQRLQHDIDFLYPRIPAEQSLVHIAEYSKESKEALQELHERIGDRLQETLSGMNESMQTAITEALNNVMAPAIQTLVSSASQQSTSALDGMLGKFMDGMTSVGREQGGQMQQAAIDVNAALASMSERMTELFTNLSSQQGRQLEMAGQQTGQFEAQLARITESSDQRQEQLEQRFSSMMTGLTGQLQTQLGTAQQRDQEREATFGKLLGESSNKQTALLDQFTAKAGEQTKAMAEADTERQNNLEQVFTRLAENLNTQLVQQNSDSDAREQVRQQRFTKQVDGMTSQQQELIAAIATSMTATQQQSQNMAQQHQQLLTSLEKTTEAVATSSKFMDSSANQLALLSTNLRLASEMLGKRLVEVTDSVEKAGTQNAQLASHLQSQAGTLTQLQATLLESASSFERAAKDASNGFGEMKQTQHEFLSGVKHEFAGLGEALRGQIEIIEKQAESWLRSYSSEVSTQVDSRMNKWNEVSLAYADQMHRTVQAMSSILDELESR